MKWYNVIIKQLDFTFVLLNQVSSIFENLNIEGQILCWLSHSYFQKCHHGYSIDHLFFPFKLCSPNPRY